MLLNLRSSVSALFQNGRVLPRSLALKARRRLRSLRSGSPIAGSRADYARMFEPVGIAPHMQNDMWMSIIHCASHSPALRPERLEAMLRARRDEMAGRSHLPH